MSNLATAATPPDPTQVTAPPRPLVLTKLYPPRLRASLVPRPNLISLLDNDPDHRLNLICAPAGYGKSTLTAQWLAKAPVPSTWVSLESNDNKPQSFFRLVVAALQTIDRGLAVETEALLAKQDPVPADSIVDRLIGELSVATRPFVLVLDDYHVIVEPDIHRAMDSLLQHMPLSMRLVLISRTEPPLQLARLRASGEICELGRQELSFTQAEALRFYQDSLGLDLTPREVGIVRERTEGWVAGLYLAGFAIRGKPRERVSQYVEEFASNAQFGNQYLWEEVLKDQPDNVRSFLHRTSILDQFTASLCDAVTETQESQEMISLCERENLFILPLDEQRTWRRYHHLFAEILRDRLTRTASDAEISGLHLRASEWLEANGHVEEAIRHAIAGRVWDRATKLLEGLCALLFERDDVATIRVWLEGLPPDILVQSPRLSFWLAWALGRTGRWSEAIRLLRSSEKHWTAADEQPNRGLVLLWHEARALYAFDNRKTIEYAERALAHLSDDQPAERVFALMGLGIAHLNRGELSAAEQVFADVRLIIDARHLHLLQPFEMAFSSMLLVQQGKLQDSIALSRRVIRNSGESPTEMWAQVARVQLGQVSLERGSLDDAQRWLQNADDLAEKTRALQWRPQIRCGLARIAWARGEFEEALDEIDRAIDFASQLSSMNELRIVRARQARFWLGSHQLGLARRWADSCELDPYLPPEYERQEEHLTYVRLLIREERSELALEILQSFQDQAEATGRYGDLVEILILTALANRASGDFADAHQSMQRALELGEPSGYLRVFVDEGAGLESLLRHATARGDHRDYARHILAEIEGTPGSELIPRATSSDALSEREVEVLRLVSLGLGNREVGQRLYISEKTVKTHLSNILSKLEATNRTQAVDQARRLGFL